MKGTLLQQRPVSPRTRQQQQSRLWSIIVLLLFLGPLTVLSGALLCGLAPSVKKPRAFAWLMLAGVGGLALLAWQWRALAAKVLLLRDAARPLGGMLRPKPNQPVTLQQISQAVARVWPILWLLWRQALLLAPMVASYIHMSKVKTAAATICTKAAAYMSPDGSKPAAGMIPTAARSGCRPRLLPVRSFSWAESSRAACLRTLTSLTVTNCRRMPMVGTRPWTIATAH
jgi:hypothetical protein